MRKNRSRFSLMLRVMEFYWCLQIIAKGHAEGQKKMALCLRLLQEASAKLGWVSHFATGSLCDLGQFTLAWILKGFDDITHFGMCGNEVPKCSCIADPACLLLPMSSNYYWILSASWLPIRRALWDLPTVPQRQLQVWHSWQGIF